MAEVPDNEEFDNGFKVQWEAFLRHVVDDEPFRWDFLAGARGVQLAELGLRSAREGRRIEVPELSRCDGRPACATAGCATYEPGGAPSPAPAAAPAAPGSRSPPRTSSPTRSRDNTPGAPAALDWDATLAFRRHLWSHGLGVAEAMDTAQRGMGLDWPAHPGADPAQRRRGPRRSGGADRRPASAPTSCRRPGDTLDEVTAAYEEQLADVRGRRRAADPDGQPAPGRRRAAAPTTTAGLRRPARARPTGR